MKIANVDGRAALVLDDHVVDIERASGGRLPVDPMDLLTQLDTLKGDSLDVSDGVPLTDVRLGPPVPRPSKILAAAGNYSDHVAEAGAEDPGEPNLFSKLPSALIGPRDEIKIPTGRTQIDWEAELVIVIGKQARDVPEGKAWEHVAGVTCGQDISDREEQFRAFEQYTMAKSFDTYAPTGPFLVTTDELENRDSVPLRCYLNDEQVQNGGTGNLIFSIPQLIAWASSVCTLEVGDLFFTGTPAGVGAFRQPPRWLEPGIVVRTEIPGVGVMENRCVAR